MTNHHRNRHRLGGLLALGTGAFLLAACTVVDSDPLSAGRSAPPDCFYGCEDSAPADDSDGETDGGPGIAADAGTEAPLLSALCGEGSCNPDLADSCSDFSGSKTTSEKDDDDGEDGGATEDFAGEPEDAGTIDDDDDDAGATVFACHVHAAKKGPERACEPAGEGEVNAPCITSRDCAPGLACVGPENAGICRPYCCGDPEACPASTFCDVRELRDEGSSDSPIGVPVCVPAMGCKLLEAEPCASMGLICGIVRADGTTSCVPPGTGKLDEPCPCAFGYVCAKSSNKCLKLCHVNNASSECPGGTCQGGTGGLPAGFGVCVGGYEDAG